MRTKPLQRRNIFPSNFGENSLIKLVIAIAICYIILHAVKLIFIIISDHPAAVMGTEITPNVALNPISRPWTLLTYFLAHGSFWGLLSNMLWLYCFGSVIQTLIGYKEITLLFVVTCIFAAVSHTVATLVWPTMPSSQIMTSLPGVVGFASGAITLSPRFRFHLGDRFAIPLWLVLAVFLVLSVGAYLHDTGMMVLLAAAALAGAGYIQLVKSGIHPGMRIHSFFARIQKTFTPNPYQRSTGKKRAQALRKFQRQKQTLSPEYVDRLLDKINQKGFHSLTNEEKEALRKASEQIS